MKFTEISQASLTSPPVRDSAFLTELCQYTLALYPDDGPIRPWTGYLASDDSGTVVGTCAFKSAPTIKGVEIAYFTFPEFEGKGIATAMARELVRIAVMHKVKPVTAQTLPAHGASTRILGKPGFVMTGTVQHPEDGEVWEWTLQEG